MSERTSAGTVSAVFHERGQAEDAISELRALGFDHDDEPDVALPGPAHHRVLDNGFAEAVRGLAIGAGIGAASGALAGTMLVFFAVPGFAGSMLVGLYVGALFGAYLGSIIGLATEIDGIEEIERHAAMPLQGDDTLVVVLARKQSDAVSTIMHRFDAASVESA